MCRMCKYSEETVGHISSECSKLAKLEYKKRHDKVAGAVRLSLYKKCDLQLSNKWYQHRAVPVI